MRWFIISILMLVATTGTAQDSLRYDRQVRKYYMRWDRLIPKQTVIQNAGNMGAVSMGIGWDYGKRSQWETHLLTGFIPKHQSESMKMTLTVKENFIPWSLPAKDGWSLQPLTCGLYINTVFGDAFWKSQPKRYPEHYYDFLSTKFRTNVFIGQRLTKKIPRNKRKWIKSASVFYEISTCDLYIRAMYTDHYIRLKDIMGLSVGMKFQML